MEKTAMESAPAKARGLVDIVPYLVLFVGFFALNAGIFLVPFIAMESPQKAAQAYDLFHSVCHQLDTRSLCYFKGSQGQISINSCTPQASTIVFKRSIVVNSDFGVGYKLPVCARDIGIYLAVLVGLIVYPLKMKLGSLDFPDKKYLFAAAVPIALDGGIQLVSDLIPSLFTYESTNALRLLTGAIIGLAIPFYLVPILNLFWRSIVSNKA